MPAATSNYGTGRRKSASARVYMQPGSGRALAGGAGWC